jgi:hypothetical protein
MLPPVDFAKIGTIIITAVVTFIVTGLGWGVFIYLWQKKREREWQRQIEEGKRKRQRLEEVAKATLKMPYNLEVFFRMLLDLLKHQRTVDYMPDDVISWFRKLSSENAEALVSFNSIAISDDIRRDAVLWEITQQLLKLFDGFEFRGLDREAQIKILREKVNILGDIRKRFDQRFQELQEEI